MIHLHLAKGFAYVKAAAAINPTSSSRHRQATQCLMLLFSLLAAFHITIAQCAATWEGVISPEGSIHFIVDGSSITTIEFSANTSFSQIESKRTGQIPVINNSFSSEAGFCPSVTVSGRFLSETSAAGSIQFVWDEASFPCLRSGSQTMTWSAQGMSAPISESSPTTALISHYYRSILGRNPDADGQAFWENEIRRSQALEIDIQETFIVLARQFFSSIEYQNRNQDNTMFITDLYQTFFNREPDSSGLSFWMGELATGLPRDIVRHDFVFSSEFANFMERQFGYPTSRAEVNMIVDFYRGLLGRLPDNEGFTYWLAQFRAAQCQGIAAVAGKTDAISIQFINSDEYRNRGRDNSQYVTDLYDAFLRRGGDLGGFNYWVEPLVTGAQTREQVRQMFSQSPEFQERVSQIANNECLF